MRWRIALAAALAGACGGGDGGRPTEPATIPAPSGGAPAVTRIMPLGDSITQANTERNSYRRPLWKALESEGRAVDFVGSLRENHLGPPPDPDFDLDHEGHWGWTADEVLAELPAWAATQRPDVVLLMLGTNDVLRGEPFDETREELAGIVGVLRGANPGVTVLMARLTPSDRDGGRIAAFNDGLPALAAQLSRPGSPVELVDQFSGFDPVADTADGLHPNAAGEQKLAARWLDVLRPHLPR